MNLFETQHGISIASLYIRIGGLQAARTPVDVVKHPRKDSTPDAYTVGYRKPPVSTRFRSGQSGNPKGRPKGARNTVTIAHDALERLVTSAQSGQRKTVRELAFETLADCAIDGDIKALAFLLACEGEDRGTTTDDSAKRKAAEDALRRIEAFFKREQSRRRK